MLTTSLTPFAWPVVIYLTLAGAAAGTALAAAVARFGGQEAFARRGFLVATAALALGAVFLIFDLESPASFGLILTSFNPASAIAWGARALVLFGAACLVAGLTRSRVAAGVAAGLAVAVAAYPAWVLHQAEARPLWQSLWIAPLLLASVLHMGLAGKVLLERGSTSVSRGLEAGLVGAQVIFAALWLVSVTALRPEGVHRLLAGDLAPWLWLGFLAVGLVVPLLGLSRSSGIARLAALGAAPLVGGLALRVVLILGGQGPAASF